MINFGGDGGGGGERERETQFYALREIKNGVRKPTFTQHKFSKKKGNTIG
jgi:hypothetical protein